MPRKYIKKGRPLFAPKDIENLRLFATGMNRMEVAAARQVSYRTVDNQMRRLYEKLGIKNRLSALKIAREKGVL